MESYVPSHPAIDPSLVSPCPPYYFAMLNKLSKEEIITKLWIYEQETIQIFDIVENECSLKRFKKVIDSKIQEFEAKFAKLNDLNNNIVPNVQPTLPDCKPVILDTPNPRKSYSEAAKSNILSTKDEHVLIASTAIREESERPMRELRVVFASNELNSTNNDSIISICKAAGILKVEELNISVKHSSTIVQFSSKEHATQVLQTFPKLRVRNPTQYGSFKVRPYYSTSELNIFRKLWAEAIRLNEELGAYVWTVRDLKLVTHTKPREWTKHISNNKRMEY
jgi:hypothetical protein